MRDQAIQSIDLASLAFVTGGADQPRSGGGGGIDFNGTPEEVQERVRQRANTCRALNTETQRLSGGQDPRPGTDAYAMGMATRACWASIGK